MSDESAIEEKLSNKGLNAPRITPTHISNCIADIEFMRPRCGSLTICVLTLKNGFTVTGESACASPENFDEEIGKDIAFKNAREKIWPLEGYLLKERLSHASSV